MIKFKGSLESALDKLKSSKQAKTVTAPAPGAAIGLGHPPIPRSAYAQSQVIYTQPQFYSPLHTPQNWQIPQKRREQYQWARYFYENEPKVAAGIDYYSLFPMNGFETQCDDSKIKSFFDNVNKKLNLDYWLKLISKEYYMLGDVFPFLEVECGECHGSGMREGGPCNHPGGNFRRLVIMNPDWIDVQTSVLAENPVVTLLPDDELRKIVWHKRPKAIYDKLPMHVRQLILSNRPIPLANESVSHLKYSPYPYGTYGNSLIKRLFKTLMYKDKLMTAQWIVAERLILPIRVVKVGDADRPAGPADIADVQAQLAQVANDPNLTLVTHHAFDYDWIGCVSLEPNNCKVLTREGLKHFNDVSSADEIATWNKDTGRIEYQKFMRKIEFDYNKSNSDGFMYEIRNKRWKFKVTPNHRHFMADGSIKRSDELKIGDDLLRHTSWSWEGIIPTNLPFKERQEFKNLTLGEFCKFAGYFVSEGHVKREGNKNLSEDKKIQGFALSQNLDSPCYAEMKLLTKKVSPTMWISNDDRGRGNNHQFWVGNADLSRWIAAQFGDGSYDKRFPDWMMELPTEYLKVIWDAMCAGDGNKESNRYSTASLKLRDQAASMLLKFGLSPRLGIESGTTPYGKEFTTHRILWSQKSVFRISSIEKIPYDGKVWCFETPNSNFFVQIGKRIILTGNSSGKVLQVNQEFDFCNKEILQGLMINEALLSGEQGGYQSSAIGAEGLIQRMESWRLELARWIEDKIYKPIAQMRGFVDEEASKDAGEPVWIFPKIHWNDLNIRDDTQQKQLYNQLHDKGAISTQTLLEKFNMDYDQETIRIRFESASAPAGPFGQPGGGGGGGGMGGGMPMGGDMGGGGAPPPDMAGAGVPGAVTPGAPLPGGGPPMGGAPMGGPPMGGPPPGAAGSQGKVLKKGKGKEAAPEESQAVPAGVRLTSLEQTMWKTLVAMRLPFHAFAQYPLGPYKTDFAIPSLKLAIEIDGQYWHKNPETKAHDEIRDQNLANFGWTVVRFGEAELKERLQDVKKTIGATVLRAWRRAADEQKNRSDSMESKKAGLDAALKLAGLEAEPLLKVSPMIPAAEPEEEQDGHADPGTGNPLG
jgi:very-short-patch-repair endonuclease